MRCVVCGSSTCLGARQHGVFKAQLAQSLGEVEISFDPILLGGESFVAEPQPVDARLDLQASADGLYLKLAFAEIGRAHV